MLLLVWLASAVAFSLLRVVPGDFSTLLRLDAAVSEAYLDSVQSGERGLDGYWPWVRNAMRGEFGTSQTYSSPAGALVWERGLRTLRLAAMASVMAWMLVLAWAAWMLSARRRLAARVAGLGSVALLSIPDLVLALGIAMLCALLGVDFSSGAVPILVLVLAITPGLLLQVVPQMAESARAPFLEYARLNGVGRFKLFWRYLLPALAPIWAAHFALSLGQCLSSAMLIECGLGTAGLGPLFLEAILSRDRAVIAAATFLLAVVWALLLQMSRMLHHVLDPRLRGKLA
jgi:ABC-type dipeptide/oligopeptide/nickel transport system permease component